MGNWRGPGSSAQRNEVTGGGAIRALIVDASPDDAELLCLELGRGGFDVTHERVDTAKAMALALDESTWDIVFSDYTMPSFHGTSALRLVREHWIDVPFVIVSGTLGEDAAVAAMRSGANDYLLKGQLQRLNAAVRRELAAAQTRQARKRAEDALSRSEETNRALLEAVPDVILRIRRDGTYLDVVPGETLDPVLSRKPIGGTVLGLLPKEVAVRLMGCIELALQRGGVQTLEYELQTQHEPRKHEARITRCGPAEVLAIDRDVTEQKNMEHQMRAAQRMEAVGRLAGGVAHDFNNLLTAIFGFSSFVIEDLRPEDPAHADMQEVLKAAQRAKRLTQQLLAFSRRQTVEPRTLNVANLIANIDQMLRRIIGEDIEYATNLAKGRLWNVRIDPGALEQVIVNLAVNARDAMPSGGKLTLEAENIELDSSFGKAHGATVPEGEYVVIAMSDNGIGMTAEVQSHIFEPFFTTKEVGKGTGLGLSTCYGIVKQAGGGIWVYSEPQEGTTFKVYLPRVTQEAEDLRAIKPARPLSGHETVLVAEDEDQVRALAVRALKKYGYTVLEARSGGDALLTAEKYQGPVHLLLTDVVMPKMSGRELAERLASLQPGLKVLYMSGYTSDAVVHHGRLDEGVALLQKPFTPELLGRKVRDVLD